MQKVTLSNVLELTSTEEQRSQGLDIADFFLSSSSKRQSFSRGEANENERRWEGRKISLLNKDAAYNVQLEDMRIELDEGRVTLEEYQKQKADLLKQTTKYEASLEEKTQKLHQKEAEFERLTKDATRAGKVMQPFRNHKATFNPP